MLAPFPFSLFLAFASSVVGLSMLGYVLVMAVVCAGLFTPRYRGPFHLLCVCYGPPSLACALASDVYLLVRLEVSQCWLRLASLR